MLLRKMRNRRIKKNRKRLLFLGDHSYIATTVNIYKPENVSIDKHVHIQPDCILHGEGGISVGEGTILAHQVEIFTRNHVYDANDLQYLPYDQRFNEKPVCIGKYVWIGAKVIILPGVSIGDGAVVGAGSVVTKDIPFGAVAGGNPARILKYRDKEVFEKLVSQDKGYIKNLKKY